MLRIENLTVEFIELTIVKDIDFSLKSRQWTMLIGPNGAGKSTIISAISGKFPYKGKIYINDTDIKNIKSKEKAKYLGILEQHNYPSYNYTIEEVVSLGRYPYRDSVFDKESEQDKEYIDYALSITGLESMRKKSILEISGGELQRTFLAQLFAQDPKVLILDEPGNHLDLKYQESIYNILAEWVKKENRAILSVVHDLSVAKYYGDSAILLANKKILAQGDIDKVMSEENLETAYGINVYEIMRRRNNTWL